MFPKEMHYLWGYLYAHLINSLLEAVTQYGLLSPIYTAENLWRGLDESGTRTKKIVLITHLHVLFSTVLNDVKL